MSRQFIRFLHSGKTRPVKQGRKDGVSLNAIILDEVLGQVGNQLSRNGAKDSRPIARVFRCERHALPAGPLRISTL